MKDSNQVLHIREQVDMYLDNELSQEDEKNLLHNVESDPDANRVFKEEKTFRKFVKSNFHRPTVSPDFIQSIKDQIKIS